VREASTPTYSGRGIHAGWLKSDQREWHVRCAHCGEWQSLSINQVVVEWDQLGRPVRWHGQAESRAWVACRKCGREVDRVSAGQWIAARPGVDIAGYHLTKLFSPATSLLDVVKALDTVDETRRKEAFNQDLGEPYTPRGGKLTETMLDDCRREYAHGPRKGLACWMGVDVGKMLHVVIRSFDPEAGERPQIWAGGIESWKELGHTVQRFVRGAPNHFAMAMNSALVAAQLHKAVDNIGLPVGASRRWLLCGGRRGCWPWHRRLRRRLGIHPELHAILCGCQRDRYGGPVRLDDSPEWLPSEGGPRASCPSRDRDGPGVRHGAGYIHGRCSGRRDLASLGGERQCRLSTPRSGTTS